MPPMMGLGPVCCTANPEAANSKYARFDWLPTRIANEVEAWGDMRSSCLRAWLALDDGLAVPAVSARQATTHNWLVCR